MEYLVGQGHTGKWQIPFEKPQLKAVPLPLPSAAHLPGRHMRNADDFPAYSDREVFVLNRETTS